MSKKTPSFCDSQSLIIWATDILEMQAVIAAKRARLKELRRGLDEQEASRQRSSQPAPNFGSPAGERSAPTYGATPQAYASGAYAAPVFQPRLPQQQNAYITSLPPIRADFLHERTSKDSLLFGNRQLLIWVTDLLEITAAIDAHDARNAEMERILAERDALWQMSSHPAPPLDPRSSSATSGPTGPTYGVPHTELRDAGRPLKASSTTMPLRPRAPVPAPRQPSPVRRSEPTGSNNQPPPPQQASTYAKAAATFGVSSTRDPRKVQLEALINRGYSPDPARVVSLGWGSGWGRGVVFAETMGLERDGPHPLKCFDVFSKRDGCPRGDECEFSHEWFDEDELACLLRNPNPQKAEKARDWLRAALVNLIENEYFGRITRRWGAPVKQAPRRHTSFAVVKKEVQRDTRRTRTQLPSNGGDSAPGSSEKAQDQGEKLPGGSDDPPRKNGRAYQSRINDRLISMKTWRNGTETIQSYDAQQSAASAREPQGRAADPITQRPHLTTDHGNSRTGERQTVIEDAQSRAKPAPTYGVEPAPTHGTTQAPLNGANATLAPRGQKEGKHRRANST